MWTKRHHRHGRWAWAFLSFRAFLLRTTAGMAGRLRFFGGAAGLALGGARCSGEEGLVRAPWPRGAMPPVLLLAPED